MKFRFRLLPAALALCMFLFSFSPSATALTADDIPTFQSISYSQVGELQVGQRIVVSGKPNFNAVTCNETTELFGFDTDEGVWYIASGPSSVEAIKANISNETIYLYGAYAGTLDANGMPILDIQQGLISYGSNSSAYSSPDFIARGKQILDEAAATAEAAAKAAEQAAIEVPYQKTGQMVWIATHSKGQCYHSRSSCSNMVEPAKVDLGYAKYMGYRACKKCYR